MAVSNINGSLFTGLSALDGKTLSSLSAVDGFAITNLAPPPTTNLWAYYEPSRQSGTDGAGMPTLTDQSGNGRHWTNSSPPPGVGTQPLYDSTNTVNGLAVAEMNGTHYWSGPDLTGLGVGTGAGKESHVFLVVRSSADSGIVNGLWDLSGVAAGSLYPWSDGNLYDSGMKNSRESIGSPGVTLITYRVYEIAMKASSTGGASDGDWKVKLDGTTLNTQTIVTASPTASPTLGRNSGGSYCSVRIAGFYIYSVELGTTPRSNVISYINTRFGLSSS